MEILNLFLSHARQGAYLPMTQEDFMPACLMARLPASLLSQALASWEDNHRDGSGCSWAPEARSTRKSRHLEKDGEDGTGRTRTDKGSGSLAAPPYMLFPWAFFLLGSVRTARL